MFRYETHCHTAPVSKCGRASAADTVSFYKKHGYAGVFITNHFLDGNINPEARELPYCDQIEYYFSDHEECVRIGTEIGIKVFPGVELSYKGTDFLIYGLDKEWYKAHPEILEMEKTEELPFMMEAGAFVIQAHPYREAHYIDHIRLFPRSVHGAEVMINSNQSWESNEMADIYAEKYGLLKTAGSDNHWGSNAFERLREKGYRPQLAAMYSDKEINSVQDYINGVRNGTMKTCLIDEKGNIHY
jgi:predicted metal-dependent phosphoesterase TrpH